MSFVPYFLLSSLLFFSLIPNSSLFLCRVVSCFSFSSLQNILSVVHFIFSRKLMDILLDQNNFVFLRNSPDDNYRYNFPHTTQQVNFILGHSVSLLLCIGLLSLSTSHQLISFMDSVHTSCFPLHPLNPKLYEYMVCIILSFKSHLKRYFLGHVNYAAMNKGVHISL